MRAVALEVLYRAAACALLAGRALCQTSGSPSPLEQISPQADQEIQALKEAPHRLDTAVRLFEAHLDDAIARYDNAPSSSSLPAADADLGGSKSTGTKREAVRKLVIARMRAARSPESLSPGLADFGILQELIAETRGHIETADGLLKNLLLVSVDEVKQGKSGQRHAKHDQLLKARDAAEQAAVKATLSLPVDLPEAASAAESKEIAGSLLAMGNTIPFGKRPSEPGSAPLHYSLNWERNRRFTLVRETGYRVAITDPGRLDSQGRHLFYQEEWVQHGPAIVRRRWRVAVDTESGQHLLLKRYPPVEYSGHLEDVYLTWERDRIWMREPDGSAEPSGAEVESAIEQVARAREELQHSLEAYKSAVAEALQRNDELLETEGQRLPDVTLGWDLRLKLFAIRGHLAGAPVILAAERRVSRQADGLAEEVESLESLASWGNRATLDPGDPATKLSLTEWDQLQARAGGEIGLAWSARDGATLVLPPDLSQTLGKFPALQNDIIVHMVRQPPDYANSQSPAILRCLEEVWRFVSAEAKVRRVQRIVTLIAVDSRSGKQTVLTSGERDYQAGPDDILEAVFDQYGGQDVPLATAR